MAEKTLFIRKLDALWDCQVDPILRAVGISRRGRPRALTRPLRERYVNELLELATSLLLQKAKKEFNRITNERHQHHIRGWGWESRSSKLFAWVQKFDGPIVYSFWKDQTCLYVGKGLNWKRLRNYEKSIYLHDADLLEVYSVSGRSLLPKAECLAVHLYRPRDNRAKVARVRWGKACPVCKAHDEIRRGLRELLT